ncbi:Ku protein [Amycolatopsis endophytica]|uniref:DNA end-binding protein Ku n=1 Tax=Amycolatopsis endophytica TaxID=860233 RepID=A0A853AW96_9PSEU|nr:DNA end-binding protein Ku [Amycolatopsis endophytica]
MKAYSATEEPGSGLHQLHLTDGGRLRFQRVCEVDGAEIPAEELGRGFALPGGDVVILSEEELASLAPESAHSIQVVGFVPPAQIDPVYFIKSYYLEPEVPATKPYVLLAEALLTAGRVALVKVAIRQRETLGALRVRDQLIVLDTMHWPSEVRRADFPFLHEDIEVRMPELRAAANLIENLSGDFEPGALTDGYATALEDLVEAKVEGREVVRPTAAIQDEGVSELLAALQYSAQDRTDADQGVAKAKAAAKKASQAKGRARKASSKARSAPRSAR